MPHSRWFSLEGASPCWILQGACKRALHARLQLCMREDLGTEFSVAQKQQDTGCGKTASVGSLGRGDLWGETWNLVWGDSAGVE